MGFARQQKKTKNNSKIKHLKCKRVEMKITPFEASFVQNGRSRGVALFSFLAVFQAAKMLITLGLWSESEIKSRLIDLPLWFACLIHGPLIMALHFFFFHLYLPFTSLFQ